MFETHIEDLVRPDHTYRQLLKAVDFSKLTRSLRSLYNKDIGRKGYHIESAFAALVLQWMEDLSDRELERFLQENVAAKLFCGFSLLEKPPDYSFFSKLRAKIGTKRLAHLFREFNQQLRSQGLITNVFNFVDSSQLITKMNLWSERDKSIEKGLNKFNNMTAKKVGVDPQARIGCKGKEKFWYGYKRHVGVCMKQGFIDKVAVTPANISDSAGLKHICPSQGVVYADKGYCDKQAIQIMTKNRCLARPILKKNMRDKNVYQDARTSKLRMP